MNCLCRPGGAWSCQSPQVVSNAVGDGTNTYSSSTTDSSAPAYAIALFVVGAIVLVMLLVVIGQLFVVLRR